MVSWHRGRRTTFANRPRRRRNIHCALILVVALNNCGCEQHADNNAAGAKQTEQQRDPDSGKKSTDGESATSQTSASPPLFRDMTSESGIKFTSRNGEEADQFTMLEVLGSGVALFDYDGDGRIDIFLAGGGSFGGPEKTEIVGAPCRLYRNEGDWKFRDVTQAAGLERPWFYNHGVAVADYDLDGYSDLVVTGYRQLALFHNEPTPNSQERRFVDVTEAVGLSDDSWSTSAGWADLDGDRYPELYVCHYLDWSFDNHPVCGGVAAGVGRDVCAPQRFAPLTHRLFANESSSTGERRFRDNSAEQKLQPGCGLGVLLADVNSDGQPDIYVANDTTNNFLLMNRSGKLEEKGLAAGVAVDDQGHADGSMGVDAADYDGSGRPALWVTNFQGDLHSLYANVGAELFDHRSRAAGISALGTQLVGFGTAFLDFDNDGWEDLAFVNGHVFRHPPLGSTFKQRPVLLRNVERNGRRIFTDVSRRGGPFFETAALGRGLAIGDLDNDGWPDVVVTNTNTPAVLLQNAGAAANRPANRWVGVRLVGRGHRDVIGSTVVVETNTRRLTRFAKGGGSFLSANDPRLLFGLAASEEIRSVNVQWSWGETQRWGDLEAGSYWELVENEPAAVRKTYAAAE